jgi:hypothetical protein
MSKSPILVSDRIKPVLKDHGVTREMIEKRVVEHRPRSRHLSVDLNAPAFQPGVVVAPGHDCRSSWVSSPLARGRSRFLA